MNKDLLLKYIENGTTLDNNLQEINKNNGFMVSLLGYEKTFNPSDLKAIENCIIDYKSRLKASQFIGLWQHDGLVYIDISRHYTNKQDAIKNGILNKQLAIYDLSKKKDILLTKKTYILYKYNKIKNDIDYITEFTSIKDMEKDLQTSYNTLKSYIIKSIDAPIKELLKDKYLIICDNAFIRDL